MQRQRTSGYRFMTSQPHPGLLFRGVRLYQPGGVLTEPTDLRVQDGVVTEMGQQLTAGDCEVLDVPGSIVTGGFLDLRACTREPGDEQEEDLASLSATAAAGGFVAVVVGPDTTPGNDDHAVTELILRRAREHGQCEILPQGALSHRLKGETLAPMGEMADAGAVCFGDGDRPVRSSRLLRRALEYARTFERPVFTHPIDPELAGSGVMHEGSWSTRLGLRGVPSAAEHIAVARDIAVCQLASGRLHFARLTTRRSVELVRDARRQGIAVTASVTPWHLGWTDAALQTYDVHWKFVAPLRSEDDRLALLEGLKDGTIDAVVSDHMPVGVADKQVELDYARPGAIGLQTVLPVLLQRVHAGELSLGAALRALVDAPRRVLSLPAPNLVVGRTATLNWLDPNAAWTLDAQSNLSRSANSPVWGQPLRGKVLLTLLRGRVVWRG